jgi:methionyl-tRNA formyltransferase
VGSAVRLVFLGSGEIGVPSVRALAEKEGHEVVAAVTQPDRPAGRSRKMRPCPMKMACEALGIPVIQPEKIRQSESLDDLRSFGADLFVVAAYGQILPRAVLEMPPAGCINIHASLLPRHRGASPIHAAILAGDTETGITIMWVGEGLDNGPILLQRKCPIPSDATAGSLHDQLADMAPPALLEAIDQIGDGSAPSTPQVESLATYAPKLDKADGEIDWTLPADVLARRVRGLNPWPGAWTTLPDGGLLKIHTAEATGVESGKPPGTVLPGESLEVQTGIGSLTLRRIQPAGGHSMDSMEFLRGHPITSPEHLGKKR